MKKNSVGRPKAEQDLSTFAGQIGARIREFREKANLTSEQCAELANVAKSTWYHFESGRSIGLDKLPSIAVALGVKTRDLIPKDSP
jgi:transcriptional regulator with XRE-family HTH domain